MISYTVLCAVLAASEATVAAPPAAFEFEPTAAVLVQPTPFLQDAQSGFSWTFGELNYMWLDSDVADQTLDGAELKGSLEIFFNLFIQGFYSKLSDDSDLEQYGLGVGWHLPVGDKLDLFGILSYAQAELDGGGFDEDEDGLTAEVGARFWLAPKLEVNGQIEWADIDESDTGLGVGARYYLIDMLSLGAGAHFIGDDDVFEVGVRVQF